MIVQGLPHACGGVSDLLYVDDSLLTVFPTHVGVFPSAPGLRRTGLCLPHACGGVSFPKDEQACDTPSSPRMWGCFLVQVPEIWLLSVFPTHVGVFLRFVHGITSKESLPHACGGVSHSI